MHFRAGYSAKSRALEPTFADLSVRYATPLQKFASVDVGRWPREAAARGVDVDAFGNNSQARPPVVTLGPTRPRSRGERRSLRTFLPSGRFSPPRVPRCFQSPPRRLSTPPRRNDSQVPSIVMYHAGKETLRAPQLYEDGSRVLGGGRMREVDLLTGFEIASRYRRTRGKDATSKKAE